MKKINKNKILNDFKKLSGKKLTEEQSTAVFNDDTNVILSARAGAGKTLTIAAKIWHLIKNKNLDPDEILVLSFNRDTTVDISARINKLVSNSFWGVKTFAAFASPGIVIPKNKINLDNLEAKKEKSEVYKKILLRCLKKQSVIQSLKIWWYLKNELGNCDINKKRFETLDGNVVKSYGELLISNYLFEHGIEYEYERKFTWGENQTAYKPDFCIYKSEDKNKDFIVWEHWAMDPESKIYNNDEIDHTKINSHEYIPQIIEKRNYWNEKNINLIETSVVDLAIKDNIVDEEYFYTILKKRLNDQGIVPVKLSIDEISNKIYNTDKNNKIINQLLSQFVTYSQKIGVDNIREKICLTDDNQVKCFLSLAQDFYEEYCLFLHNEDYTDYNTLLELAIDEINKDKDGSCEVRLTSPNNINIKKRIKLDKIKWIMVDEYQDLSRPFFNLISAIRNHNPSVKLFCVGDDWQAINGFAGSDLKYFTNFETLFPEGKRLELLTNRRSLPNIINASNLLMKGEGNVAISIDEKEGGEIHSLFYEDFLENDLDIERCKIFSTVMFAAFGNKDTSIAFLSRYNKPYGIDLNDLKREVLKLIPERNKEMFKEKCLFKTVHSFKGKEADIVIVLDSENFGREHSSNKYFEIFRNKETLLKEEKRVFYVAQTRAKNKLIMLASYKESLSTFAQNSFSCV